MGKFTLFIAFNADNHRLQNAPFATVDRHNGAARGA
jgi:ribosome-binding ATPase YchF (GTP1/OBG family)